MCLRCTLSCSISRYLALSRKAQNLCSIFANRNKALINKFNSISNFTLWEHSIIIPHGAKSSTSSPDNRFCPPRRQGWVLIDNGDAFSLTTKACRRGGHFSCILRTNSSNGKSQINTLYNTYKKTGVIWILKFKHGTRHCRTISCFVSCIIETRIPRRSNDWSGLLDESCLSCLEISIEVVFSDYPFIQQWCSLSKSSPSHKNIYMLMSMTDEHESCSYWLFLSSGIVS